MQTIFLNYRRDDESGFVHALYARLELEFPPNRLFMDVEGLIRPGDDFARIINSQVEYCDILLAFIGPRWLDLLHKRKQAAVDFVVVEIEAALQQGKRLIPVLVANSRMPPADQLPPSIARITQRQAVILRPERFKADCEALIASLKEQLTEIESDREKQRELDRAAIEAAQNDQISSAPAIFSAESGDTPRRYELSASRSSFSIFAARRDYGSAKLPQIWLPAKRMNPAYPREAVSIPHAFLLQRQRHGGAAAAIADLRSGALSYDQLLERAVLLARFLVKLPEQNIGVLLPNSVNSIVTMLALHLAAKVVVPLNCFESRGDFDARIELAGVRTVVTSKEFMESMKVDMSEAALAKVVPLDSIESRVGLADRIAAKRIIRRAPDQILEYFGRVAIERDIAAIIPSTVTPGSKQGVSITHGNILSAIDAILECLGAYANDVFMTLSQAFQLPGIIFGYGFPTVAGGRTLYEATFDVEALAMQFWRGTVIEGPRSELRRVLQGSSTEATKDVRVALWPSRADESEAVDSFRDGQIKGLEYLYEAETGILCSNRADLPARGCGYVVKYTDVVVVDPTTDLVCGERVRGVIAGHGPGVASWHSASVEIDGKAYVKTNKFGYVDKGMFFIEGL